jgi:hypothetical protein
VQLEDTSTLGRIHRMVEIDPIGDADEQDPEWDPSREWTKRVPEEPDSLRLIQLGRADLFRSAS